MKQTSIPRRRRYRQLLKEYEQYLRQRERDGEIKEVTRHTYLNDAHRVTESLVAALPAEDIKAKVGLLYRGYYGTVIKELKVIMEHRH